MTTKHPVLLVDDEPEILLSLRGLLRQEFELHTAEGGAAALDLLGRTPVHVILSDQRMPGMTGGEFLRRSRAVCPNAVRMLFTGYADLRAVIEAINQAAVHRYLTKPWDPDELVEQLHQACAHYAQAAEGRRLLRQYRDHAAGCPAAGGAELVEQLDRALAPEGGPVL